MAAPWCWIEGGREYADVPKKARKTTLRGRLFPIGDRTTAARPDVTKRDIWKRASGKSSHVEIDGLGGPSYQLFPQPAGKPAET